MNIIQFDHCLYQKNIERDFVLYLVKNKKIRSVFKLWTFYLLRHFSKKATLHFWLYIDKNIDMEESLHSFFLSKSHKINQHVLNAVSSQGIILTKAPKFLVEPFLPSHLNDDYCWNIDFKKQEILEPSQSIKDLRKQVKNKKVMLQTVIDSSVSLYTSYANDAYLVKRKKIRKIKHCPILVDVFFRGILLICLSLLIVTLTFLSASNPINWDLFWSYYHDPIAFTFNYIPVFVIMLILYLLSGRLWVSFLFTELPFGILAYTNFFKLKYRDYPVVFSDLNILSEAKIMAGKYDVAPTQWHLIAIFVSMLILFFLIRYFPKKQSHFKINLFLCLGIFTGFAYFTNTCLLDANYYDVAGDESTLDNRWIASQQIQRRGLIYPFIYSYTSSYDVPPENYNEQQAQDILSQYTTQDIPENQKVNIVSIMLESYNDFTKFNLPFTKDIYKPFHQFQKEGYYGEIASNVFGGGTVNTERSFVTGYFHHPLYLSNTNSYIHYFNAQGYNTVALHPCYGSFYNRRNINQYLGYDEFYYVENRYGELSMDDVFFPDIIEEFERQTSTGQPYFNFSLNYQGHGPYPDYQEESISSYINMPNLDSGIMNQLNHYFSGIENTNKHLEELYNYFKKTSEPVILVLYGDHNPVFGAGTEGFELMGINMDTGTEEGFMNYYYTPYVIWANPAAKKTLGNLPKGKGPTISPNFLMNELFYYLGWQGSDYMQYTNTIKEEIPVIHDIWKKTGNVLTQELDDELQQKLDEFEQVEYYYYSNFLK